MSAATWREMMALKATAEPMLMRERRQVRMQVSATAFAGMCMVGCTLPIHWAKGKPLSRAKAKVWREVEALKEMFDAMTRIRTMMVRALTPPVETACRETEMKGKPDGSWMASWTEVRQKR